MIVPLKIVEEDEGDGDARTVKMLLPTSISHPDASIIRRFTSYVPGVDVVKLNFEKLAPGTSTLTTRPSKSALGPLSNRS